MDSHDFGDKMIKVVSPIKVSETPLFQYVADFDVEFNGRPFVGAFSRTLSLMTL